MTDTLPPRLVDPRCPSEEPVRDPDIDPDRVAAMLGIMICQRAFSVLAYVVSDPVLKRYLCGLADTGLGDAILDLEPTDDERAEAEAALYEDGTTDAVCALLKGAGLELSKDGDWRVR